MQFTGEYLGKMGRGLATGYADIADREMGVGCVGCYSVLYIGRVAYGLYSESLRGIVQPDYRMVPSKWHAYEF